MFGSLINVLKKDYLQDIDLVIIMVKHNEIVNNLDLLKDKIVLDTKNIMKGAYKL